MNKAEKKALEKYPVIMQTLIPLSDEHEEVKQDCNKFIREAYKNGYIEGFEDGARDAVIDNAEEVIKRLWHSVDENPEYPCDILYVTNVDNIFLYRYMENGRPVNPPETPYFRDITNGKCWCYCKDIMI